ncbi:MAG TPA: hypothetical protein VNO30_28895 [Kofleriaceae bacterium]|nr:hypothetical protein [Kofleriaceae bacterium]
MATAAAALAACGAPRGGPGEPARCPAGAVRIGGPEHARALAGCARAGAVTIRTGAALDLGPLGALEVIDGDLAIGPSVALADATLPALREVGGALRVVGNGDLRALRLPRLARAGRVSIEGNSALAHLALPALREVRGGLEVTGNPDLELLDAGALEVVGGALAIEGNASLVVIEAARLLRAGDVRVANNRLLPDDVARALLAKKPEP